jgi:hypothetical protein
MSSETEDGLLEAEGVVVTRAIFDSVKPGEMLSVGGKNSQELEAALDAAIGEKANVAGANGLPKPLSDFLGLVPKLQRGIALDSVAQGLAAYKSKHGREASADTLAGILASVKGMSDAYSQKCQHFGRRHVFDDVGASSASQSNTYALTAGPVTTAVMQLLGEEIPFAGRAPAAADAGGMSNFRLGVVRGIAGSDWAEYANKDVIDGLYGFKPYIMSERIITLSTNGGGATAFTGTFRTKTNGSTALPLMAGLTEVRVNGLTVGVEPTNAAFGSAMNRGNGAGQATLVGYYVDAANATHTLTASTVNALTGAYSVRFDTALPAGTLIELVGYADYEGHADMLPVVGSQFDVHDYVAKPYMAHVIGSMVAMQQAQAETGTDLFSAANMFGRSKVLAERYMMALKRLKSVAKASTKLSDTWDMNWQVREQQLNIAHVMLDFLPVLSSQSANMAAATQDHGIDTIYCTGLLAQYIEALPATHFQPSGIPKAPGIFRMGRLTNQGIDVYWIPKDLATQGVLDNDDAAGTTEVLTIGRGTSTARSTIIVADPVAATLTPLASQSGNDVRSLLWGKSATELNKHELFRQGVGYIKVTGLVNT